MGSGPKSRLSVFKVGNPALARGLKTLMGMGGSSAVGRGRERFLPRGFRNWC